MTLTSFRFSVPAALRAVLVAGLAVALWAGTGPAQTQGYSVQPGDTLTIEVLEDSSLNRNVLVTPDGSFTFPFAGTVQAAGRTPAQISQRVTQRIASNFAVPPNVFISVRDVAAPTQPRATVPIEIYMLGEVNAPGPKQVPPGVTLLQALAQTGGFTNFAAIKRLQLRRTDPHTGIQSVTTVNYRAIADGAALNQNIVLVEGDVILVPQRRLFE